MGDAGDGQSALACIQQAVPDVLMLDVGLPDENGLQVLQKVVSSHSDIKVIILSADSNKTIVSQALREGAAGFLAKEEASNELVRAIRTVMSGQVYLSPIASTSLAEHFKTQSLPVSQPKKLNFSDRELEVLKLVVEGMRNKEIADRLGIGLKSVESYRARLMAKAECSSPAELVRFALKHNIVKS